jgi:hypothetical protein
MLMIQSLFLTTIILKTAFHDFTDCDIYQCIACDILHQNVKGNFAEHYLQAFYKNLNSQAKQ